MSAEIEPRANILSRATGKRSAMKLGDKGKGGEIESLSTGSLGLQPDIGAAILRGAQSYSRVYRLRNAKPLSHLVPA